MTDILRRDIMVGSSLDDTQINYSSGSTDWKAKYDEVADMLSETRAELDDFHHSSKELEEELIRELERTEKAQKDLLVKVSRAESDRDDWKSKFVTLQTTYNTATTSLQRELDQLRQQHQKVKVQLRELEMGNDDLERNERAVTSSLADIEAKYSRALEEKILLEHELLDKANIEEELQRLKDELRDANVEISILKDQLAAASARSPTKHRSDTTGSSESSILPRQSSEDDLMDTAPPADLQLSDLDLVGMRRNSAEEEDNFLSTVSTPPPRSRLPSHSVYSSGQSALLNRAGFQPPKSTNTTPTNSILRSNTVPSLNGIRSGIPSPRTPTLRQPVPVPRLASTSSNASTSAASKNKGVQMVSEMRARVRNLEQKIHTRVPRLRMGSITGKPNNFGQSTMGPPATTASGKPAGYAPKSVMEEKNLNLLSHRRSVDVTREKMKTPSNDTSGWVLIMEDSPSPQKDKDKERRRISSPANSGVLNSFRSMSVSTAGTPSPPPFVLSRGGANKGGNPLAQSVAPGHASNNGARRPASRLSAASSTATSSSIPTPSSRPSTPTFLPLPSTSLYGGMKRSTGPGALGAPGSTPHASSNKRSSLGASTAVPPMPKLDAALLNGVKDKLPPSRPPSTSSAGSSNGGAKALPHLPGGHSNVTIRAGSGTIKASAGANGLGQSRIGRLSGGGVTSGRKSAGGDGGDGLGSFLDSMAASRNVEKEKTRPRAGSAR